jgi:squalene-associated FAD-dependent desaturase
VTRRIAVVGGGLAGITTALCGADAGHEVVLLEAHNHLGGLTTSFRRDGLHVDNGQHVFLRCCTSYRRLLRRLGVEDQVTLQNRLDIPVVSPRLGRPARLRRNTLPAPLHLGGALLRYPPLTVTERLSAVRAALALRRLDLSDPSLDEQTFGSWLADHGQRGRSVDALWDLLVVATLNAHSADASLALAAMVFQTGLFSGAAAGDIGWARIPLRELHGEAAQRCLRAAGVEVRTRAKVSQVEQSPAGWIVMERDGARLDVDAVVLAVPPAQAERLLPADSTDLPAGWAERLGTSPIVNVHVVFDRQVMDHSFVAGVDTPAQWIFDRTSQSGLVTGQYLAVSVSAADDLVDLDTAQVRARILPAVLDVLPRARDARLVDFFVTRERSATFRPLPGTARLRPGAATRCPGLALAGAWTATGWPATMEGAVRSGEAAAAALDHESQAATSQGALAS